MKLQLPSAVLWLVATLSCIAVGVLCGMGNDMIAVALTFLGILLVFYLFLFKREFLFQINLLTLPLALEIAINPSISVNYPSEFILVGFTFISVPFFLYKAPQYKSVWKHPVTIILLLQAGWMFLNMFFSDMHEVVLKRWVIRMIYILVYFFLTIRFIYLNPSRVNRYFLLYAIGLIIPSIISIEFMARFNFSTKASYMAGFPFYKDHTIYGAALAFVVVWLGTLLFRSSRFFAKGLRQAVIVLFIFLFSALFFSFSRAAWLSCAGAILFGLLIHFRVKLRTFYMVGLAAIILILVNWSGISDSMRRSESISNKDDLQQHVASVTNLNKDASNLERVNRWVCALRMFYQKPITGYGAGTYQFYYGEFQTRENMTHISTFNGNRGHAHSEYLGMLAEQGIPGFILLLLFFHQVLATGVKLYHHQKVNKHDKTIIMAVLLALVTFMLHSFFNGFMETDKMAGLVFIGIAILVFYDIHYSSSSVYVQE